MTMKILHVIKSLGLGGAESLLVDAARAGPGLGLRHDVVSFLPWKDALVPRLEAAGAEVEIVAAKSSAGILASVDRLAAVIRRRRPDVVHAHLPISGVVARVACALTGTPCVYTEHNLLERYHPATLALALSTWTLQRAVIACSGEVKASIERNAFFSASMAAGARRRGPRLVVVQNGISAERFAPPDDDDDDARAEVDACKAGLGFDPDAVVVGTIAVQRTQKALDRWLAIAAVVHRHRPQTRFVLVGDGPLRPALEAQARGLGLDGVVVFAGLQREPRPFLWAMDIFLSTSIFEGLPLALLEAMAAGRAVVATAVGGVKEVVDDGISGVLLPGEPGRFDHARTCDAVTDLVDDVVRRRLLGNNARAVVEERFSTARMQRELAALYASVA